MKILNIIKYPFLFDKKYNPICFLCFAIIYYLIGYLFSIDEPNTVIAANWLHEKFSSFVIMIPRYSKMFNYLSGYYSDSDLSIITLSLMVMIILLLITILKTIFFKEDVYVVGYKSFHEYVSIITYKKYTIYTILFLFMYLFFVMTYFSDRPYGIMGGDLIKFPFGLMVEMMVHHVCIFIFFFLIYVVPFIYLKPKHSEKLY